MVKPLGTIILMRGFGKTKTPSGARTSALLGTPWEEDLEAKPF